MGLRWVTSGVMIIGLIWMGFMLPAMKWLWPASTVGGAA